MNLTPLKEKSVLFNLSREIADIDGKNDMLNVIRTQLKSLFYFTHSMIGRIDDNNTYTKGYITDACPPTDDPADFQEVLFEAIPIGKGIIGKVIQSDKPLIVDLEELMKEFAPPGFLRINFERGSREALMVALRTKNRNIGYLALFSDKKNNFDKYSLDILHDVASIISIAVSNIIANEKITNQLEEIKQYKRRLEEENSYLQQQIETNYNYSEIIGTGPQMQKVYQLISQVSFTSSTVLILGETGTGKELIARAIHNSSPRKDKLMIKVNCAALPANLIESELFGHERGSFTGATDRRIGKFELANNSTLFLDEIGEMPPDLQVKLLRALQEREIERIGGRSPIKINVRIIAATNRDLHKEVKQGRFRSDLYYRLNVFPILMPALRDRKEDILVLASHFINRYSRNAGKNITGISHKAKEDLTNYTWPGNVRELEHLIERSILMTTGNTLKDIHLPFKDKELPASLPDQTPVRTIEENERDHILKIIKRCRGRIAGADGAASLLGVPPSTLNSKILKLGITKEEMFQK